MSAEESPGVRGVLVAMRRLLAEPEAWTQGSYARNAAGRRCGPLGETACAWCLSGAMVRSLGDGSDYFSRLAISSLLNRAAGVRDSNGHYVLFNDHPETTHGMVLGVLDRAIEAA